MPNDQSPVPNNDWIILKLDEPLNLGGDVQKACLPLSSSYLPLTDSKDQCWTSGWGHEVQGELLSNVITSINAFLFLY